MPRFLTLFTADQVTAPTPEHVALMGKYVEQQARAGRLIATGGLKQRARDGLTVRRKGDSYTVADGGAPWAAATGYAILDAPSREQLIADVKGFLGLVGDGVSEIIEISEGSPPQ
ncbi:MAG: YciI family protein [Vitreimonas sp.]